MKPILHCTQTSLSDPGHSFSGSDDDHALRDLLLFFYRQLVREARRNEHRVALPSIPRRLVDRALVEDGVLEVPLLKTTAPVPLPLPQP